MALERFEVLHTDKHAKRERVMLLTLHLHPCQPVEQPSALFLPRHCYFYIKS